MQAAVLDPVEIRSISGPDVDESPGHTPLIGALVVTWNRKPDALECIWSLTKSAYPRLSIYVVDNASNDGTFGAIAESFPDVHLIRSEVNLGFAGGNNLGLERMLEDGVDAAFLINDDAVVAPDTLVQLVDGGFHNPSVGVLGPKVLMHSEPGVIWAAGGMVDAQTGIAAQRHYGEIDRGQADEPIYIDYAVGCAMLVKSDAILKVGLMDPRYFMYYEETDWCRRIREAGYRVLYVPGSRVWHKVSRKSNGRNNAAYYFSRNRLLYLNSSGAHPGRIALVVSGLLRGAVAHSLKGRRHDGKLMFRAVIDYYSKTFGKYRNGS